MSRNLPSLLRWPVFGVSVARMTDKPEGKPDATPKPPPSPADPRAALPPAPARDPVTGRPASVSTPAAKPSDTPPPPAGGPGKPPKRVRKPFPWPLVLALVVPLGVAGLLGWLWQQEDLYTLGRTAWICLSVVLPGFGVMTILGGVTQFRRRPIFSTLALLLAIATVAACVYGFQVVTEASWLD